MTTGQINQMLAQMRAMAAQAASQPAKPAEVAQAKGPGFADVLKGAVGNVNNLQAEASQKADAMLRGEDVPLTEVMVSLQKARVGFEAVKQVRNRLLEAYQEISRMQV